MHRLLERQIKKTIGDLSKAPVELVRLIESVDQAYHQSDDDRLMLERSMELSSRELHERNTELTLAEAKYRSIFENATEGIFQTTPEGRLISANPALAEIFGFDTAEELIASNTDVTAELAVNREQRQRIVEDARQVERVHRCEVELGRRDGSLIWVAATMRPVRDGSGAVIRYEGTAHDITARRKAEAERAALQTKLLDLSRQSGMSEVATGVLHNVGNVLNSVNISLSLASKCVRELKLAGLKKAADLLCEHSEDLGSFISKDDKGKRIPGYLKTLADHLTQDQQKISAELDSLSENVDHIKRIVSAQQTYARTSGYREQVDLSALIEDVIRLNRPSLKLGDADLLFEFSTLPVVTIEKHQVMQILVNLLNNGVQAIGESGRPGKLIVRMGESKRPGGYFFVSVQDTGIGIPRENLDRIFNHGFTTKAAGHGFGLHRSANSANSMGGSLSVESDGSGRGATFTLELPMEPHASHLRRSV